MEAPTEYLPKTYHARMSTYWWLARWPYLKFILRELSSVFVAWFVIETLLWIRALERGPAEYAAFELWLQNPLVVALNVVTFLFVFFHAITWFNLAPKAMAVRMGGRRVPGALIAAPNYAAWIVISAALTWLLLRG
jgi:succinate dehydrogenase subunit C